MPDINLGPDEYRPKGTKRVTYSFFEALSFAIASTLATRKKEPADPDKTGRTIQALGMGLMWYLTHRI